MGIVRKVRLNQRVMGLVDDECIVNLGVGNRHATVAIGNPLTEGMGLDEVGTVMQVGPVKEDPNGGAGDGCAALINQPQVAFPRSSQCNQMHALALGNLGRSGKRQAGPRRVYGVGSNRREPCRGDVQIGDIDLQRRMLPTREEPLPLERDGEPPAIDR